MTDLQIIDKYLFITKRLRRSADLSLLKELEDRSLQSLLQDLPENESESRSIVRSRMFLEGRYIGDPTITEISQRIARIEVLRIKMQHIPSSDTNILAQVCGELSEHCEFVNNFYKSDLSINSQPTVIELGRYDIEYDIAESPILDDAEATKEDFFEWLDETFHQCFEHLLSYSPALITDQHISRIGVDDRDYKIRVFIFSESAANEDSIWIEIDRTNPLFREILIGSFSE